MTACYHFLDGHLVKSDAPEWFANATREKDGSWSRLLREAGAISVEDFDDGGNSIEIYEAPDGTYFIGFWDANKCFAEVFIDNIADYLLFRARYIAPLASLIMETERHSEWEKRKRPRRVA
jgi:hypothetical protein